MMWSALSQIVFSLVERGLTFGLKDASVRPDDYLFVFIIIILPFWVSFFNAKKYALG